jgi:hypothetical protein
MAGAPYQRKPGVAVKAATNKRKLRAYVTQPRLILMAMEIRERRRAATADPALSFADTFATLQELARELVDLCAAHLNDPDMHFTPINIGENEWGPEGLLGFWVALGGHFETLNLGLFGVLRALQENADGFNLKSRVWGLLDTALGRTSFHNMVIFNIVCFAAPFDVGEAIMERLPPEVCEELNELQVAALNSLGTPAKFAGFGGAVSLAGDRGIAQVGHAHLLPARRCRSWRARVGSAEAAQLAGVHSCAGVIFRSRPHLFSRRRRMAQRHRRSPLGPGPRSFPLPRARLHTFENLSLTFTSTSFPHHFFPHPSNRLRSGPEGSFRRRARPRRTGCSGPTISPTRR